MNNSKLITLLKGLKQQELHWFQKFLASPFYNNNEDYIRLFFALKKYYPVFDSSSFNKEIIWKRLFPREKFNPQKLRKTMHGLHSLAEDFLVAMQVRKDQLTKKKLLIQSLGERNIYSHFKKKTQHLLSELTTLPYQDVETYKEIYDLSFEFYGHLETKRQNRNIEVLQTASENLDYFYLLQKQQIQFAIKNHERLFKDKLKTNSLNQIKNQLKKEPVFILYDLIIKSFSKSNDEKIFEKIDQLFKGENNSLSRKDKLITLRILLNYFSRQINLGKEGFQAKTLALYKFGLDQNLLIENNQISPGSFINISTVGFYEKEFKWTEQFIQKYKAYLPDTYRADATNLSMGFLFYNKKEYAKRWI